MVGAIHGCLLKNPGPPLLLLCSAREPGCLHGAGGDLQHERSCVLQGAAWVSTIFLVFSVTLGRMDPKQGCERLTSYLVGVTLLNWLTGYLVSISLLNWLTGYLVSAPPA